jgi:hypothetical protein
MIITYVDLLTKQAHFLPCNSTITAEGVADMHVKRIFPLHGTPEKFISDRGPQFAARMMSELYRQLGIDVTALPVTPNQTLHYYVLVLVTVM